MACVHLLTRVIPPLFAAGPNANLADLIFWSTGPLKASSLPPATSIGASTWHLCRSFSLAFIVHRSSPSCTD